MNITQNKFEFEDKNEWNSMSWCEKHLLIRILANQENLKSVSFADTKIGEGGAKYIAQLLSNEFILERSEMLKPVSLILASLHPKYINQYINSVAELGLFGFLLFLLCLLFSFFFCVCVFCFLFCFCFRFLENKIQNEKK